MEEAIKQFITHDGLKLSYRYWPAQKERPCIVYLHGLESHMGWFSNMADFLNKSGFNVYAFDRRGSGLNKEQRGNLYNYRHLFEDIKIFLQLVKENHPASKIFLMGLCLGGKIAVNFLYLNRDSVDGLILVSPSIRSRLQFSLMEKVKIVLSAIFYPKKMFKIPIADRMFTANKKYLEFIKNDPLRLRLISASYLLELVELNTHLSSVSHNINIPVLVMLAGIDEIVDTEGVTKWFARVTSADKTLKIYKDYYHILLFEDKAEEVMRYISNWIETRSK